uniref:TLC domain-containing protein n=1 Tax=Percolomonas cosmopolitus TaxID=63605 RepID=A0A7S1PE75_9EUKA|mmetsp:Transcript_11085/g.41392  ORF Transcript_11085/g.41392 Transcript_11085/m.41392 type:complete len:328 (+) Transcript_11085:617-1600(+)
MISYIEHSDVVTQTFKKYFFLSEGHPMIADLISIVPFIGFFLLLRSFITNMIYVFAPGIMKHNNPTMTDHEIEEIKPRLADQGVKLMFHLTAALFASQYFGQREWWLPDLVKGKDTVTSHVNLLDKVFFMYQAGYHMQSLIHFFFLETKRKADDFVMGLHHVVTIMLILGSYLAAAPYMQVGICVFYVHDASDVFVATTKSLNYIQLPKPILAVSLVSSILGWIYFRIFSFACHIIYVAAYTTKEIFDNDGWTLEVYVRISMTTLMMCLWSMHVYWLKALVIASYRLATKSSNYDATDDDKAAMRQKSSFSNNSSAKTKRKEKSKIN